jgi:hypothetical protein
MPIPLLLAAAPAIASSVFGAVKGIQSLNEAKKIKPEYYGYGDKRLLGNESAYAKQMLGQSQMQLNARNPFAAAQQRGILGSQANAMAGAQRAVTDPSQALAMTAALQANTDQALFNQAGQEQQAYQQRMGNLMGAQQVMISEGDKVYQDRMRKFQMDQERKDALQQAGTQSLINAGTSLSSSLLGMGKAGGFGKMFGGGGGGGSAAAGSAAGIFGGGGSSFISDGYGGGYQTQGIGAFARSQGLLPKG